MFYEIAIQNLLREVDKLESTIRDLHKQNNELHEINCQLSKENSDMVTLLKSTTQSIKDLQRTLYIIAVVINIMNIKNYAWLFNYTILVYTICCDYISHCGLVWSFRHRYCDFICNINSRGDSFNYRNATLIMNPMMK
jgi:hypothetical protein